MKYLLDTVVWVWSLDNVDRLTQDAKAILQGREEIYLSAATSWEISIKVRLGKLNFPEPPGLHIPQFMATQNLLSLPIRHSHAHKTYELPLHHRDPFDRMLIAQAMVEDMTILTADRNFEKYTVKVIWCGK